MPLWLYVVAAAVTVEANTTKSRHQLGTTPILEKWVYQWLPREEPPQILLLQAPSSLRCPGNPRWLRLPDMTLHLPTSPIHQRLYRETRLHLTQQVKFSHANPGIHSDGLPHSTQWGKPLRQWVHSQQTWYKFSPKKFNECLDFYTDVFQVPKDCRILQPQLTEEGVCPTHRQLQHPTLHQLRLHTQPNHPCKNSNDCLLTSLYSFTKTRGRRTLMEYILNLKRHDLIWK